MNQKPDLTGYLIDTRLSISKPVCIENSLNSLYASLHCEIITITYLPINGKEFCIIADDEGLLKPNRISAAEKGSLNPMLVGSILITSAEDPDDTGHFVSLSSSDISSISERITTVIDENGAYPVVLVDG